MKIKENQTDDGLKNADGFLIKKKKNNNIDSFALFMFHESEV